VSTCNHILSPGHIIEQESYAYSPIECARLCLNNLRRMLEK